jgi:cytochrome P450
MTLLYMINTPRVLLRVRAELAAALAANKLRRPVLQDAEARQHLPYLQAVLREGLRVFPPATSLGLKTVPAGGDVVSGHWLPPGTQVGMNAYGILHARRYWGDDADVFRPERWLELGDDEALRASEAFDVLFGQGRYKCLGRALALIEMNKLLPEVRLSSSGSATIKVMLGP